MVQLIRNYGCLRAVTLDGEAAHQKYFVLTSIKELHNHIHNRTNIIIFAVNTKSLWF